MIYQWRHNTPLFASQHPGVDVAKTRVLTCQHRGVRKATAYRGYGQDPGVATPIPYCRNANTPPYQLLHPPVATTIPPSTQIIHIVHMPPWGYGDMLGL